MNYIQKLFTDKNGNPSSKRLNSFVGLLLVIVFSIKGACNQPVNMEIFWTLVGFTGFQSSITLAEKKEPNK